MKFIWIPVAAGIVALGALIAFTQLPEPQACMHWQGRMGFVGQSEPMPRQEAEIYAHALNRVYRGEITHEVGECE